MRRFFLLSMVVFVTAMLTFGQSSSGRLVGTVSGPDGVIPGASVEIKDTQTGKTTSLTTNDEGAFTVSSIDVGEYTVVVKAKGFKTYTGTNLKIDIGREYSLPVMLEVGGVEETVTVTAGADIVNSSNPELSTTVSQRELSELPLNGRNPLSLVGLQPGNNNAGISGGRSSSTNYTRDGVNVQDIYIRNGFVADTPTTENTAEFTVATANTGAESGFGSSQVQISTPRGGREYHGALFVYNRNAKFAANNFFSNKAGRFVATDAAVVQGRAKEGDLRQPRPFLNRNQFGGKFSGPLPLPGFGEGGPVLIKNKAFFFFSIEKFELRQQVSKTTTVLRPDARNGIFAYRPTAAPVAGQCITFTGGVCTVNVLGGTGLTGAIPAASATSLGPLALDSIIQQRLINTMPAGNRADIGDGLNTIGYAFNQSDPENRREYTFRADGELNQSNTLGVTYRYNRTEDARTDIDGTFSPTALSNTNAPVKFLRIGWINTTGNLTNEVLYGIQKASVGFFNTNLPQSSVLIGNIPLITPAENNFRDQGRDSRFWTIADRGAYVWGNHTLRFGGEYQKYLVDTFLFNGVDKPTFNISTTGNINTPRLAAALFPGGIGATDRTNADNLRYLLAGVIGSGTAAANATSSTSGYVVGAPQIRKFTVNTLGLYLSDQWRVFPNFTLTLGLRYERYSPLKEKNLLGLEPVIANGDPVATVLSPTGTIDFLGKNSGEPGTFAKPDNNNFGPSIGFAYTFGGKSFLKYILGGENESVIRGGFSMKYVNDEFFRSQENALANNAGLNNTGVAFQNGSASLNARLNNLPAITAPTYVAPPFSFANQVNAVPLVVGSNALLSIIDPELQVPLQKDFSLSYTRQIGRNRALQISYVNTQSDQMVRTIDYGQVDITKNGFGADYARALNNFRVSGNIAGTPACLGNNTCQALTVIPTLPAGSQAFIAGNITQGTPADDAITLIINGTVANPTLFTGNVRFLENPRFSPINLLNNGGRYNYNALQAEFRQRFSQGLLVNANYSFQKILTDVQDDGINQARVAPYLDNNNPDLNYSRPAYDITHTFNVTSIYDLPFGKGRKFLNSGGVVDFILGGWSMGNVVQMFTRPPLLFLDNRGTLNRSGRSGFQTGTSNLTTAQIRNLTGVQEANGIFYYISPSVISTSGRATDGLTTTFPGQVFFNNQPNTTGNIQRYAIDGTFFWNWDVSLQKAFKVREGMRVVVRAEAFNATNSTRFQNPNTNLNSNQFGRITAASAARVMQFGARFEF